MVNEPGQKMRGCKRPSLTVPGEKWDFLWPTLSIQHKSSIFAFFYEQKSMRKELVERGITEGYRDWFLIGKQENQGCVKGAACALSNGRSPSGQPTLPCQIPKSQPEVSG